MDKFITKAIVYFAGDWSVGISSYYYTIEVPPFDNEGREEVRKLIESLYTELDGEFKPKVIFEDEINQF